MGSGGNAASAEASGASPGKLSGFLTPFISAPHVARAASYHDVLGVGRDARPAASKKAYAKLALRFHPDRCTSPGATAAMARINEAYEQAMLQAKARYR